SSTLLGNHPTIRALRAQVAEIEQQIAREGRRVADALESQAQIEGDIEASLRNDLARLKQSASTATRDSVTLDSLQREAKAQRDLLESYLAKYREATARESLDTAPSDVRIISRATPSNVPAFPKKVPIVVIATMATAFAAATLIVTGELLGGENRAPARESGKTASLYARLRSLRLRPRKAEDGPAPATASLPMPIEELATALRQLGEAGRRITVIGAARHVGTTMTALGLARHLARQGRTILVDLALNAPNLSVVSTDPGAPGLAELVRGTASFGQIVTRDRFSPVHLVAAGQGIEPAAMLASPRLAMTLEAFARTYAHVVIDAGAVPEVDVAPVARFAPRAVLVASDIAAPDTLAARDRLLAAGFSDVTMVLGGGAAESAPQAPAAA
ncbi:MAG: lipopolysaccharide biosynthesis protein, partial [Pseudorhodoplanes sp.]